MGQSEGGLCFPYLFILKMFKATKKVARIV